MIKIVVLVISFHGSVTDHLLTSTVAADNSLSSTVLKYVKATEALS